jgi:lipopolysaccharide/colanic/teichoic acid biosynthesis glycosyltransferase
LTGYWQVNGKNQTTFGQMIEMDIYYANNMSLKLDLIILLMTLPAIVRQTFCAVPKAMDSLMSSASLGRAEVSEK